MLNRKPPSSFTLDMGKPNSVTSFLLFTYSLDCWIVRFFVERTMTVYLPQVWEKRKKEKKKNSPNRIDRMRVRSSTRFWCTEHCNIHWLRYACLAHSRVPYCRFLRWEWGWFKGCLVTHLWPSTNVFEALNDEGAQWERSEWGGTTSYVNRRNLGFVLFSFVFIIIEQKKRQGRWNFIG